MKTNKVINNSDIIKVEFWQKYLVFNFSSNLTLFLHNHEIDLKVVFIFGQYFWSKLRSSSGL